MEKNVKDILDDMSSNYSIIKDKVERYDDYFRHSFRDILSNQKQFFNCFIEINKDDCYTGT